MVSLTKRPEHICEYAVVLYQIGVEHNRNGQINWYCTRDSGYRKVDMNYHEVSLTAFWEPDFMYNRINNLTIARTRFSIKGKQ